MTISPQDFIYKSAYEKFLKLGYSGGDAADVAAYVVNQHKRGQTFKQALDSGIAMGKHSYHKVKS